MLDRYGDGEFVLDWFVGIEVTKELIQVLTHEMFVLQIMLL